MRLAVTHLSLDLHAVVETLVGIEEAADEAGVEGDLSAEKILQVVQLPLHAKQKEVYRQALEKFC